MKLKPTTVAVGAAVLFCLPALFGADDGSMTQQGMNANAAAEYRKADAELNVVYLKLLASKGNDPAGQAKLEESERQWIQFRDADAESAAEDYRGGSMASLVRYTTLKDLTAARTADLKARLELH